LYQRQRLTLELIGPADDRGYDKFNRSAISFMPDFDFSKIRDDELMFVLYWLQPSKFTPKRKCIAEISSAGSRDHTQVLSFGR
jgi:hypothetical protein